MGQAVSLSWRLGVLAALLPACTASPPPQPAVAVAPAPPPKDDGKPAKGGEGGAAHAAALEQLKVAPLGPRVDKQNSVVVNLPDAQHWMRVKFWGVPSVVGFRYGKDHHAVVGAIVTHVDDNTVPGACMKSFEEWATPLVDMFEVDVNRLPSEPFTWPDATKAVPKQQADVAVIDAKTATIAVHDRYAVAYATYPAWGTTACLVVGVAIPARDEDARAAAVRDRFVREVLPSVQVISPEEPKERF
jgi:hypothetical protein